ncbi:helix-turn-helix domain-containing protein [Pseudonocardia xinjiangensis]|uniref:helix-turn-helix domain-containing protein n=1 Tax=Pseudonocardia xinjiangensis TaxID=75289 RepID=UPI003D945BB8
MSRSTGPGDRRWASTGCPPGSRFDAWRDVLGATHLPFAVDLSEPPVEAFSAEVREHHLGDLTLVDTRASPHRGVRRRRQVAVSACDVVGLQYVVSGRELVDLGHESAVIGPGDLLLWHGDAPVGYEVIEPLHKRTLILPRAVAAAALPGFRGRFLAFPSRTAPVPTALVGLLALLSTELTGMDDGARAASAALTVQLVRLLDPGRGELARHSRRDLRDRVLQYVDDNLGDPALSPATIAVAHAVSVRNLYSAFDGLGTTPAAHIRHQRLARCRAELADTSGSLGDIAFRWGFRNRAHFSRLFRDRYAMPPSEVRRRRGR